jgi:hypothetical protein
MNSRSPQEQQELTVKGETIESVYRQYRQNRYWVNRRYQRKLIWTMEEKQGFIDSVSRGYPVPIVLLAESASREPSTLEIIDGMQRLNAIASFIENDYAVGGAYFDLNTTAVTKELFDNGEIKQKEPALDRAVCVKIASYLLPVSVFEFTDAGAVDEVFRRINSGGRKLSRQELRTAGATGHFATAVRRIAAQVRGDDSYSDTLRLNDMASISITNRDLPYGIPVDTLFWVSQNILTKEQVRESRDEEIVADILAYMVLSQPPSSRSEFFDDYYGIRKDEAADKRFNEVEIAVQKRSIELIESDFVRVLDALRLILAEAGQTFGRLVFQQQPARAPRYFQVIFLAFYTLMIREGMAVADVKKLIGRMTNQADSIAVPEGGRWGGEDRHNAVQAAAGVYREAFEKVSQADPATIHWITRIENLLSQSLTEQSLFDFKQGFLRLDGSNSFDEDSFNKILQTCAAIANNRKGCRGYVLVGVCDQRETAARVKSLYGIDPKVVFNFSITGVEHEARALGRSSDQMFQMVVDQISRSKLSSPLKEFIARHLKPIRYFDKTIYVFESEGQEDPSSFDGKYFDRRGAQLEEVMPDRLAPFMRRYLLGG